MQPYRLLIVISVALLGACGGDGSSEAALEHVVGRVSALDSTLDAGPGGLDSGLSTERNFDRRAERSTRVQEPSSQQLVAIDSLKTMVGQVSARFDPRTGVTRSLVNPTGYLTAAAPGKAPLVVADRFVRDHVQLLGLVAADLSDYEVTDTVHSRVTGATHIYLRQRYKEIPVYNGQMQIHVNRDGRIIAVNNSFVPNLAKAVAHTEPGVDADVAVATATATTKSDRPHWDFGTTDRQRVDVRVRCFRRRTPSMAFSSPHARSQARLRFHG